MGKRHSPEQIIRKLRDAEARLSAGTTIPEVARELGISEATFHRWTNLYGGMSSAEAKRLKELEKENARLKKLVAEQALNIVEKTSEPEPEEKSGGAHTPTLGSLRASGLPDGGPAQVHPALPKS
jgi:putative transposase